MDFISNHVIARYDTSKSANIVCVIVRAEQTPPNRFM